MIYDITNCLCRTTRKRVKKFVLFLREMQVPNGYTWATWATAMLCDIIQAPFQPFQLLSQMHQAYLCLLAAACDVRQRPECAHATGCLCGGETGWGRGCQSSRSWGFLALLHAHRVIKYELVDDLSEYTCSSQHVHASMCFVSARTAPVKERLKGSSWCMHVLVYQCVLDV